MTSRLDWPAVENLLQVIKQGPRSLYRCLPFVDHFVDHLGRVIDLGMRERSLQQELADDLTITLDGTTEIAAAPVTAVVDNSWPSIPVPLRHLSPPH